MAADLIYAFRVMRLPLLDAGGAPIGRIEDIVAIPGRAGKGREPTIPPRVVGFVANSQRRRIFVNANRIAELNSDGARLRSWDVDLNPFKRRSGEVLIGGELIDRRIGDETVSDIALRPQEDARSTYWVIDKVRLARRNTLRRRPSYRLVDFDEVPALFEAQTAMQAEAARLREFHPAEVAAVVRALPIDQRRQLAEAMDDERLADVLEELPEEEQVRIVEQLDRDRLVGVFDEMEYDDLADLLGEMKPDDQERMLGVMDVDDAEVVRRLLSYEEGTAGGLMTPRGHHPRTRCHGCRGAGAGPRPRLGGQHRHAGLRHPGALQGADRQARRRRPHAAPPARASEHGDRASGRRRPDRDPGCHRP